MVKRRKRRGVGKRTVVFRDGEGTIREGKLVGGIAGEFLVQVKENGKTSTYSVPPSKVIE